MIKAWLAFGVGTLLSACGMLSPMRWVTGPAQQSTGESKRFTSNGERIYFTATNEQGDLIPYEGGPAFRGMMMQPRLACVSCHGTDGRGGRHIMHMLVMDAPDIRYQTLNTETGEHGSDGESMDHSRGEYDRDMFRQAVVEGKHPDGEVLSTDMPRWEMSDQDLADLFEYLKSLP